MTAPDDSTTRRRGDLLSPFLDEELFPEETDAPPSPVIGMLAEESPFLRDALQAQPETLSQPEGPEDWEETEAREEEDTEIEEVEGEGRLEEEAGEEAIEFEEPADQANTYFRIANDITSAFEGGKAGKLNLVDNGIISYGKHQATLGSGSLFLILKRYADLSKSETARSLSSYLDRVRRKDATLGGDEIFKGLLKSAAHESAMQQAQDEVFAEHYWNPAKKYARNLGIRSALGHVLLYNVRVQGGLETVIKLAKQRAGGKVGDIAGGQPITEAQFLSAFVDAFIAHRLQNSASNAAKAKKLREEVAALERQGLGSSRQAIEKRARAKRNERNAGALKTSATRTRGPSFRALVDAGDLDLRGDAKAIVRLAGKHGMKIRGLRPAATVDEVRSEYEEEWAAEEEESYLAAEDEKSYQPYTPEVGEHEEAAETEEPYSPLLESEPEGEEPEEPEEEWPVAEDEKQAETWSEWAEPQTAEEPEEQVEEWGEQEERAEESTDLAEGWNEEALAGEQGEWEGNWTEEPKAAEFEEQSDRIVYYKIDELRWPGATSDQLNFMQRVYKAHIDYNVKSKKRQFSKGQDQADLEEIEPRTGHFLRRDAAVACRALLNAARDALEKQKRSGDRRALSVAWIKVASAYRSPEREFDLWQKYFRDYYRETENKRQSLRGGEHGGNAVVYMAKYVQGRKAAPGYGFHTAGLAADLQTKESGKVVANRTKSPYPERWRKCWLWDWLTANASKYGFFQNKQINEPWHWEYRGAREAAEAYETRSVTKRRAVVARVPLLAGHHGTHPDLVLKWNDAAISSSVVDVVIHLHGYSGSRERMVLTRDKEPKSGLDFHDPDHPSVSGRVRPSLLVLPRGNYSGGRSGKAYNFPALVATGAVRNLIEFCLGTFARAAGVGRPGVGRLILTAHSGGGSALMAILRDVDPQEVFVFDALYGPPGSLIDWARKRIERDIALLKSSSNTDPDTVLKIQGGALRVIYRPGTATEFHSKKVRSALEPSLRRDPVLSRRYRVEGSRVAHDDIPRPFGWRLLTDASCDLPLSQKPGQYEASEAATFGENGHNLPL